MGHRTTPEAKLLAEAIALAARCHLGQTDKAGEPYILHPLRVMLACQTPNERLAAVLHDTIEDTGLTFGALRAELPNLPPEVVDALDALSHRAGEDYFAYVERLKPNVIARAVKKADLWDNYLNPDRKASLRPELHERYSRAWAILHEPIP